MRILIISDAWYPQVNGVVRTLDALGNELRRMGHDIVLFTPQGRRSRPMPFYPEIRLSWVTPSGMQEEIRRAMPASIHIATEGPLGWAARRACLSLGLLFTTGFHTRFADYAHARLPLPGVKALSWAVLRRFHQPSRAVMVPTASVAREVEQHGIGNTRVWTRGADHQLFRPWPRGHLDPLPRPILLYAGRVSVEKGIGDFLSLQTPGTKVVVGDGPARTRLEREHPEAVFTGYRFGEDYARSLAAADVFVFPSRTDTFGLVMLEAMSCGTPVAGFPVSSPIDVVEEGVTGALDADLSQAVLRALRLDRQKVALAAQCFTWERTAGLFESWLTPAEPAGPRVLSPVVEEQALIHRR
jgi:glycosyltransferase involved in cell wall biosynthesis